MKDNRKYLKIACLLELVYVLLMFINYLFFTKFSDEVLANIFLLFLSLGFTYMLYNESKKDIDVLKQNKFRVLLASIWLFAESIIPGVLGFIFLSSISDKKKTKLPDIKEEKTSKKSIIKSALLIVFFMLLMFIFPLFDFYKKIPVYFIYIFIFLVVLAINFTEVKNNLKIFIKNFKIYFPFVLKRYFIMLGLMIIVAVPIVLLNNGRTSSNQEMLNVMFKKIPLVSLILSTLYAPFVEENIFRLSLSKIFKNENVFIIISGLLFGALHIIDKFTSFTDLLYIFQYATLGICLAKAYVDSKNIFVPISMHFIQNFIAAILVILLY